jgi:hypothetical protein
MLKLFSRISGQPQKQHAAGILIAVENQQEITPHANRARANGVEGLARFYRNQIDELEATLAKANMLGVAGLLVATVAQYQKLVREGYQEPRRDEWATPMYMRNEIEK